MALSVGFTSCSSDDTKDVTPEIILSASEIAIPQQGEETVFYIKCNVNWTITGETDWCTVSPSSGDGGTTTKVFLNVSANQSGTDRTNVLYINAGADSKSLTINQLISMSLNQTQYTAKAEGDVVEVKLNTVGGHSITVNHNWITRQTDTRASEAIVRFVIAPNVTGAQRTGTITFKLKGGEETVTINQDVIEFPTSGRSGMESDAMELAGKMISGWNLGNTLEATGRETSWGNPVTTQAMSDMVKEAGFNAVRIPCNLMSGYVEDTEIG